MKRWGIFLALLTIFGTVLLASTVTIAQDQPSTRSLQISPLHTFVDITPGSSYTGSVTLKNSGIEALSVSLDAEAFTVNNEEYDYTFMPDSPINGWVHFFTPELTLQPDQSYEAKFLISAPIDAEPGGVYLSIFASSLPTVETSIKSVDRVGSLFYINLAGDTSKRGELLKFSAPWIHNDDTIPWSATIRNAGTTHFNSKYEVSLQTLWGSTISKDTGTPLILPRSVRLISNSIESPRWIGIYKITHTVELGDNETDQGSQLLFYAPLAQLLPILAIIGGLAIIIRQLVRKHRVKR